MTLLWDGNMYVVVVIDVSVIFVNLQVYGLQNTTKFVMMTTW